MTFRSNLVLALLAFFAGSPAFAVVGARVNIMDQRVFSPTRVQIRVGQSVEFKNASKGSHTVTADPNLASDPNNVRLPRGAKAFNSGRLLPGAGFSHTFTQAGTYQYVCLPHESMGMIGQVVVTP